MTQFLIGERVRITHKGHANYIGEFGKVVEVDTDSKEAVYIVEAERELQGKHPRRRLYGGSLDYAEQPEGQVRVDFSECGHSVRYDGAAANNITRIQEQYGKLPLCHTCLAALSR